MEEILQMSALELSKQIRHGSVSVKEAVEACKNRYRSQSPRYMLMFPWMKRFWLIGSKK